MPSTTSEVQVRHATIADAIAVRRIVFTTLNDFQIPADPDGSDADVMEFGCPSDLEALHLVAEVGGRVVGSIIVGAPTDGVARLSKLFVSRPHRRQGIGRALLRQAVDEASHAGYRRLEIHTRAVYTAAVHIYEASGWRRGVDHQGDGPNRVYSLGLASDAPEH